MISSLCWRMLFSENPEPTFPDHAFGDPKHKTTREGGIPSGSLEVTWEVRNLMLRVVADELFRLMSPIVSIVSLAVIFQSKPGKRECAGLTELTH